MKLFTVKKFNNFQICVSMEQAKNSSIFSSTRKNSRIREREHFITIQRERRMNKIPPACCSFFLMINHFFSFFYLRFIAILSHFIGTWAFLISQYFRHWLHHSHPKFSFNKNRWLYYDSRERQTLNFNSRSKKSSLIIVKIDRENLQGEFNDCWHFLTQPNNIKNFNSRNDPHLHHHLWSMSLSCMKIFSLSLHHKLTHNHIRCGNRSIVEFFPDKEE